MAVKIIKHRLFTWFEEVDSPVDPAQKVLTERIAHMGDEVDITNPAYVKRGEQPDIDAFYTDAEAEAIRNGTYNGPDRVILENFRSGIKPPPSIEAVEGEHGDVALMDSIELAEYIKENKLNIPKTLALAGDDEDSINKVLDAENIATNNTPRAGVVDALEAKLNAATRGGTQ